MAKIVVKRGDTVSSIAARNGVSVNSVGGYGSNANVIRPGQVLTINKPAPRPTTPPAPAYRPPTPPQPVRSNVPSVSVPQSRPGVNLTQAMKQVGKTVSNVGNQVANTARTVPQWVNNVVSQLPQNVRGAATQAIPGIAKALQNEGILTPKVLAYALATIQRETAGTFRPIEEYGGRQQAVKHGYSGGQNYFGRGYIQLTHDYNYRDIGRRIGMGDQLVNNPSLALNPDVAAKALAAFFKDRGVANAANKGDFYNARRPVNGTDQAGAIAGNANKYLASIGDNPISADMGDTGQTQQPRSMQVGIGSTPNKFSQTNYGDTGKQFTASLPSSPTGMQDQESTPTPQFGSVVPKWGG